MSSTLICQILRAPERKLQVWCIFILSISVPQLLESKLGTFPSFDNGTINEGPFEFQVQCVYYGLWADWKWENIHNVGTAVRRECYICQ